MSLSETSSELYLPSTYGSILNHTPGSNEVSTSNLKGYSYGTKITESKGSYLVESIVIWLVKLGINMILTFVELTGARNIKVLSD